MKLPIINESIFESQKSPVERGESFLYRVQIKLFFQQDHGPNNYTPLKKKKKKKTKKKQSIANGMS